MNVRDIQKTDKAINKNNAVGINISPGSTGWKDQAETITEEAKGSTITVGRTAAIIAKEDMTVKGSIVNAKDIHLKAGNNIRILSSENKSTTIEDYKAKSGSIGASISKGGYGIGASYGKGKGQTEETILTHTPSDITAKDTVSLSSGNDTVIRGGTVKGNKVTANAGRMSIESEQDKKNYKEKGKTSGLSISYTPGSAVTVSGGKGKTNTDSTYESVTKQAGIYAGKEGYDIQVKNNTRLKGAVIDSQAEKEKNRITTGTLTWENIENKAEYKTGGHGISYNGKIGRGDKNDPLDSQTNNRYGKDAITGQRNGMNKITPTIYGSKIPLNERGLLNTPIPSVKGKAGTTTRSAVSKGTITITDKENQKQDIEKLNRNTEDSLNKLKEIFDKTKVEERKRLLEELGIVGNRAIHEIASHNGWKDGSTEKIALHGMLGAITSAKSGGSALSGLIAGGANEYAIGYLEKSKGKDWINKHPDTVQNISAAFGGILSKMTGGSGHTGAYISQMGTKWNLEAKDTDDVYVVIYDMSQDHVVGHSALVVGNEDNGYTEVGFGPSQGELLWKPVFTYEGEEVNKNIQGKITEDYYFSLQEIQGARIFKLNLSDKEKGDLIDLINRYQGSTWRRQIPIYEPDPYVDKNNPYWWYNLRTNNCNEFIMRALDYVLPKGDERRKGINFDNWKPKEQGDNLEGPNQLVNEVVKL